MLNRILLGVGLSWVFSSTLGLVFAFCAFGKDALGLPAVFPMILSVSTMISLLFAPLAVWAAKTGARNLLIYGPILWLILAGHIVIGVKHLLVLSQGSLFVLAVVGLVILGLIPRRKRGGERADPFAGRLVFRDRVRTTTPPDSIVVTGALSYTGKYVTQLLLNRGCEIRTLTYHVGRTNPFGDRVRVFPFDFDHPDRLSHILRGASTLINTYWVRFPRGRSTFESAVQNTRTLISAAKYAGVARVVHVSIANPSPESPLAYYRGKAEVEKAVMDSGLSYAILRPTVIFGSEDVLLNNIAWFIRRFPLFAVPGDGRYSIRPIHVADMAHLIAQEVDQPGNTIRDAVGPETFTFEELVKLIAAQLGRPARLVHVPMPLAYVCTLVAGWFVGDVVLTWEEYKGLMGNLLAPGGPSTGQTRLSQWLAENHGCLGMQYASEVARHYTAWRQNPA